MLTKKITALLGAIFIFAQSFPQSNDLNDAVPFNPEAKKVILANGFTYYISRNVVQPGKIYVDFNVKAGNFQADSDQTVEIPHLIEHMGYRTTPHLKGYEHGQLHRYLKEIGATYNAGPNHEFTDYWFSVPSDTVILKDLFVIYSDWISGKTPLKKDVVDAEKNVVISEFIFRGGEWLVDKVNGQLLGPSRYSRMQDYIGALTIDKISRLSTAIVRRFRSDWYRPDLSGLIVVGDLDIEVTEQLIRRVFTSLQNPIQNRVHNMYPVKLIGRNHYIIEEREDDAIYVQFVYLKERLSNVTYRDYKESTLAELFNGMMENRMSVLYPEKDPFVRISIEDRPVNSSLIRALTFHMNLLEGKFIEGGLKTLFTQQERIKRFGFSEKELEDVRRKLLNSSIGKVEPIAEEALRYSKNFVYDESAPSKGTLDSLREQYLQETNLKEINQFAISWLTDKNRSIVVGASLDAKPFAPTEPMALAWLEEVQNNNLLSTYMVTEKLEKPHVSKTTVRIDFDSSYHLPTKASYTRQDFPEAGITELQMSNGSRVILKPRVASSDNRVYLKAVRPKGASDFEDQKYYSARLATQLISCLGELSTDDLKLYNERGIKTKFEIGDNESAISGVSPEKELETLLQLTYRYFLEQNNDSAAFKSTMSKMYKYSNPEKSDKLSELLGYRESPSEMWLSTKELDKVSNDLLLESYDELFSSPGDFTFVITGVQDMSKTISFVTKYLGNLPARNINPSVSLPFNQEPRKYNVKKAIINKKFKENHGAEVLVMYVGHASGSIREEVLLQLLVKSLERASFERLRQRENGTYAIYPRCLLPQVPSSDQSANYEIGVKFKCLPSIRNRLIKAVQEEVNVLKKNGPRLADFKRVVEEYKIPRNLSKWNDEQWAYWIAEQYKHGRDFNGAFEMEAIIKSITPADIQKAAREYLKQDRFVAYSEVPGQ